MCINKAPGGEAGGASLAVQYPADLAWAGITCHVLDQRTLKMKQVRTRRATRMRPAEPRGPPWHYTVLAMLAFDFHLCVASATCSGRLAQYAPGGRIALREPQWCRMQQTLPLWLSCAVKAKGDAGCSVVSALRCASPCRPA